MTQWPTTAILMLAGVGVIGAQVGVTALASMTYPVTMRSTGLGWALGVGRVGSIVGPTIGGFVLATAANPRSVYLGCIVPVVDRHGSRRAAETPDATPAPATGHRELNGGSITLRTDLGFKRIATEEAFATKDLIRAYRELLARKGSNDIGFNSLMGYYLDESERAHALGQRASAGFGRAAHRRHERDGHSTCRSCR